MGQGGLSAGVGALGDVALDVVVDGRRVLGDARVGGVELLADEHIVEHAGVNVGKGLVVNGPLELGRLFLDAGLLEDGVGGRRAIDVGGQDGEFKGWP